MKRLIEQEYIVRKNFLGLLACCLAAYFSYHIVQGDRSYMRYISLSQSIQKYEIVHETLSAEKEALYKKVSMMRPGSVDRDLVEEQVRKILGFRHAQEWDYLSHDMK